MPRFFVDSGQIENRTATVFGEDAHHISRSLRMAAGETFSINRTADILEGATKKSSRPNNDLTGKSKVS